MPEFTHADAQSSRERWFRFLDVVSPTIGELHGFCRRLTHTVWDAEDLLQETLLKGFGMTARGDLHGDGSAVRNAKAYLFRIATNHWIDQQRKARREVLSAWLDVAIDSYELQDEREVEREGEREDVGAAIEKALENTSPQEFAALVLKEGYDFTLEEIADFVGASVGGIKSSLSRGRRKLASSGATRPVDPESRRVAQQFAQAINAQDLDQVLALMSDTLAIVVCNVGGGRGKSGQWTEKSVPGMSSRYVEHEGEALVLLLSDEDHINGILRVQASGGEIVRITDYYYAPETTIEVAAALGLDVTTRGYRQPDANLAEMLATTELPWRE